MLTDRDQAILDFEAQWWKHAGAKEQSIRDLFDLTSTRYYQLLNHLIDEPAAAAYAPSLVARLHRIRDQRQHSRLRPRPR